MQSIRASQHEKTLDPYVVSGPLACPLGRLGKGRVTLTALGVLRDRAAVDAARAEISQIAAGRSARQVDRPVGR